MVAGCVLKKPPDAAAIKEIALPAVQARSGRREVPAPATCPATGSRRSATISCQRRSPKPSLTTSTCASELRESNRRSSTPGLPAQSCGPRSISSRAAAASCPATARASRARSSPRTGRSTSGAGCATAVRQAPLRPRRRRWISSTRDSRLPPSWPRAGFSPRSRNYRSSRHARPFVRARSSSASPMIGHVSALAISRMCSWRAPAWGAIATSLRQLELGREQAIRALEILLGRYPSAACNDRAPVAGLPRRGAGGTAIPAAGTATGRDRRRAARRGCVQPHS